MAENQSNTDKLFKGMSVQTIITIVMGVLEIVVFSVISRLLTKSEFGYYAALLGITNIFISISEAGLGASVIQKKNVNKNFVSTAFTLSFIVGIFMSVLLFILAPFLSDLVADSTLTIPLQIMSSIILMHGLISVANGILKRELKFKTLGIINIVSYIISSIIGIIMAVKGLGLYSIITSSVTSSLLYMIIIYSIVKIPQFKIEKGCTKEIVSFGGWLTFGVILNNINHQLDKLLLPKWVSVQALGTYNRPAGFISTISIKINAIFDSVLFPILSSLQDNKNLVSSVFLRSISLLNSFAIILAAIIFFNAELIITIFFGNEWLEFVPIMQIISISVVFGMNSQLVDCFFRSLAFLKTSFFIRLFAVIMTFSFIYIGSKYGILGVALSIVFSNIITIIIKILVLALKIRVSMREVLFKWFISLKSVTPLLFIGVPYLIFVRHSILLNILFAFLFATIVICEFVFYPKLVGKEYLSSVYPKIEKLKNKIIKK